MDWQKIKAEYLRGGITTRELAKKYGVNYSKLAQVCAREKWAEKRKQVISRAEAKVIERTAAQEADNITLMNDLWNNLARLTKQSMEEMVDVSPAGLEHYSNTLEKLQKGLGVKDPVDMEEQKARIAKLRKDTEAKDKTEEITVDLGEAEAWAR